jgi:hypothetical protein
MLPGMDGVIINVSIGSPDLSAATSVRDAIQYGGAGSSAILSLTSDGEIHGDTAEDGDYLLGDWLFPKSGMEQFSARWTNTDGTLDFGTAGSWEALTSTRSYGVSSSGGAGNVVCTGTLEIARTDNTAAILATKAGINLRAHSSSGAIP